METNVKKSQENQKKIFRPKCEKRTKQLFKTKIPIFDEMYENVQNSHLKPKFGILGKWAKTYIILN